LILGKVSKFDAAICQLFRLKCTKFDFRWRSAPDPAEGAYSAPPDHLAGFMGPTSKRREGRVEGGKEEERMGKGRVGEGKGFVGPISNWFFLWQMRLVFVFSSRSTITSTRNPPER